MVGQKGSLVIRKPHSEIINDLILEMKSEYDKFVKSNEYLSKEDYVNFLTTFETEFKLLEEAGEEIRSLEGRLVGQLNEVQGKLKGYKKKLTGHKNKKALVEHIDKFLRVTDHIEKAIRRGAHVAMTQEGVIRDFTKKS